MLLLSTFTYLINFCCEVNDFLYKHCFIVGNSIPQRTCVGKFHEVSTKFSGNV